MVVEASPPPALIVAQAEFLLEFAIVPLENGGEKVDHGSGGMTPLRAAQ